MKTGMAHIRPYFQSGEVKRRGTFIIGTVAIWAGNTRQRVVLYDYEKCVEILMEGDEDRREEGEEFLEFNTLGAYVGEKTPAYAFITRPSLPD